ncbi:P-II family nitrogen regulator [Thermomonas flagellata]|uniref:P-II family nitrogen regulator n=1 Tax=Thermomonas flagellata TaxID=2888524 RepID=UPI003CE4BCFC
MTTQKMRSLKKLEIILDGAHLGFATDLIERAGVKGYTILHNLSGKGSTGFHAGQLMFNEDDVLVMVLAAVPEDLVDPLLEGFAAFFAEHSGVVFVSDIQVMRPEKFGR